MTLVDLLSDTVYPRQAVRQLHKLLGDNGKIPVKPAQIYGLRQIARRQPDKVLKFAEKQGERAERLKKQFEVDFWARVAELSRPSTSGWSVYMEGHKYLPDDIREENIPLEQSGMSNEEREHCNRLKTRQKEWLNQWANDHIPAFYERFCTQCLYRKAIIEMFEPSSQNAAFAHQNQSEGSGSEAMQRAFADVGMQE